MRLPHEKSPWHLPLASPKSIGMPPAFRTRGLVYGLRRQEQIDSTHTRLR